MDLTDPPNVIHPVEWLKIAYYTVHIIEENQSENDELNEWTSGIFSLCSFGTSTNNDDRNDSSLVKKESVVSECESLNELNAFGDSIYSSLGSDNIDTFSNGESDNKERALVA